MSKKFVDYADDSIARYFKEVRKTDLLTPEEEVELAIKIKEGDDEAKERLVKSNLKFVISIAKEYQGQGLPLSDLINDGNEGLIKAAYRFDHTKGFRFISYAVWWIRQSIMQSLNDNSRLIRLPSNVVSKLSTIRKEIEKFESENGREPVSGDTIIVDGKEEEFKEFRYPTSTSLNRAINEDGDELIQVIPDDTFEGPDNVVLNTDLVKKELMKTLDILDERERDIVECYFGINTECEAMTLEAIGDKYELTKERIRQIKEKAIRKLRYNVDSLHTLMNQ